MANLNQGLEDREKEGAEMAIALDFTGWQPGGTTSDLVRDGQYEVQIMSCLPKAKKGGGGMNANIVFKIVEPRDCEYRGKQLVVYHPIPIGDSQSPDNQKKRFLHNLFYSIVSGLKGTSAAEALKSAGVRELKLSFFVGKRAWIKAQETTDQNQRPVGEVRFYITKEQYDQNPGPAGVSADPVDLSKSAAAAIDSPAAGGNGSKPPADTTVKIVRNPVDDILGG